MELSTETEGSETMAIMFEKKAAAVVDKNGEKHYILLTAENWHGIEKIMKATGHSLSYIGNALVDDALKGAKTRS